MFPQRINSLLSILRRKALYVHHTGVKVTDAIVFKACTFFKAAWNPFLRLYFLRVGVPVDFCQQDVSMERPRIDDHRAHLRIASQKSPVAALPDTSIPSIEKQPMTEPFYFPEDTRPGLLEVPDLTSPSKFEELSQIAVGESRRLLLCPETFTTPKRAVQV